MALVFTSPEDMNPSWYKRAFTETYECDAMNYTADSGTPETINWYGLPLSMLPNPGPGGKFWFTQETQQRWRLWQRAQKWATKKTQELCVGLGHSSVMDTLDVLCEDSWYAFAKDAGLWDNPPDEGK